MARAASKSKKPPPSGRSKPARKKSAKARPKAKKPLGAKRIVDPLPGDPFEL